MRQINPCSYEFTSKSDGNEANSLQYLSFAKAKLWGIQSYALC